MQKYRADRMNLQLLVDNAFPPMENHRDVYLASEVDAKFKEYDDDNVSLSQSVSKLGAQLAEKDATIVELKQAIATLSRSNTRLRQKIDRLSS